MMRRPWQVWLLFAMCVLAAVPAMIWVTCKAIELDRAEVAARRQAEQEEEISRTLWRIDARVTPLLAEEAARPDFVYQSLRGSSIAAMNPESDNNIAEHLPDYVLLHFEIHSDGRGSSPQIPAEKTGDSKSAESVGLYSQRLTTLLSNISFDQLLDELPEQTLPQLSMLGNHNERESQALVIASNGNSANYLNNGFTTSPNNALLPSQSGHNPPPQATSNLSSGQEANELIAENEPPSQINNARQGKDLQQRDAAFQSYAQRTIVRQRSNFKPELEAERKTIAIREGISRPLWLHDKLIFARRVQRGGEAVIQGCWLDWPKLRHDLLGEAQELLPQAELAPLDASDISPRGRLLATLPVLLAVPPPQVIAPAWSPIQVALLAVWICLALAVGASAWLLQGVITLSERRASFVAAVTHELRTPLTTFRMYAEMLAGGMVREPSQQQAYLETLRIEADRLTHLVDNVLLYARLERTSPGKNRIDVTVDELFSRFASRLVDRASQADLTLQLQVTNEIRDTRLHTDPGAVEQILFNLIDNACKYAAQGETHALDLSVSLEKTLACFEVRDYGPGLSTTSRRRLFQPFSKTSEEAAVSAPGVGLGLALAKRLARELGGELRFQPAIPGARFVLSLPR